MALRRFFMVPPTLSCKLFLLTPSSVAAPMLKTLVAVLRADAQDAGEFPLSGYVFVRQVVVFPKVC